MAKVGRKTKFKTEYIEQVKKLCALGSTDIQIADFFNVCEKTINIWKHEHPEFLQSLKDGKLKFDSETVVKSLLHRATGYSHKEDKILSNSREPEKPVIVETTKHYPPDTTACIYWLNNRLPEDWKNVRTDQVIADEAQSLNINFNVKDAQADIQVTKGQSAD